MCSGPMRATAEKRAMVANITRQIPIAVQAPRGASVRMAPVGSDQRDDVNIFVRALMKYAQRELTV
jgi:hypothetical protein